MPFSAQLQAPTPPTTPRHALAPSHAAPPSSAILISPTVLLRELALILVCAILCSPAWAQRQQTTTDQPMIPGVNNSNTSLPDQNSALHGMSERMAVQRNIVRQKQIISDTARLLQLAEQLNDEVSKSNKDTLSVSVVKKAEEIEKLAKSVKQKMRDGE